MFKILVVEDDKDLNRTVCSFLNNSGYEAKGCLNALDAYDALYENVYDLIVSDIMMPEVDGFEFARNVRAVNENIPILFMTAKDDKPSKMLGYNIGIDEYVTKPFDMDILLMTIKAILRRAKIETEKEITIGNLSMNVEERTATLNGEEIALTVREFDILFKMLSYPKKTFTRSALMAEFWDYDSSTTSRTVDVYMAKLREKTSECDGFEIATVHGLGYKVVLK